MHPCRNCFLAGRECNWISTESPSPALDNFINNEAEEVPKDYESDPTPEDEEMETDPDDLDLEYIDE